MHAPLRNGTFRSLSLLVLLVGSLTPLALATGCEAESQDSPNRSGVVVSGVLRHALVAESTESADDGAAAATDQASPLGTLAIVALGTNSETISVPLEADGSFELPVAAGASYTLNVLDTTQDVFVASFLFRAGPNVSSALRIGAGDVALGSCQLVDGEVWCENGFFDAQEGGGAVEPMDDLFGVVRLTFEPHPSGLGLITEMLGGTVVDIELAPNPRNPFHVVMFNRSDAGCAVPLFGVGEKAGDDRFLYTQYHYVTDTCQATGRYHATCTMNADGDCVGFIRLDLSSSGSDCSQYPSVHVAERFRARLVEPGVLTCAMPPTCSRHTDCASRVCNTDVGFCDADAPNEALRLYFFDVGNGQSILAVSPTGTAVLMDAGRPGGGRLVTTMARRLVNRLDYMVLSHFDADHAGGAVPFMMGPDGAPGRKGVDDDGANGVDDLGETGSPDSDDLVPAEVFDRGFSPMPSGFEDYASIVGDRRRVPEAGETIDLGGGVTMTVLTANGHIIGGEHVDVDEENARSVGVLIQYGDFSFLNLGDLPGGSGKEALEQLVLPALADVVPIDFHLLSHHGSGASSSPEFIAGLQPRVVAISVGDSDRCGPGFNSYGLPTQSVIDAVVAAGSVEGLYQTEAGGASFTGQCDVNDNQLYPRDYGDLAPVFTYSAFTVSAYRDTFRVEGLLIDDHYQATGCVRDACPHCPDGYVEDPEDAAFCILDPCVPDPCSGRGLCAPLAADTFDCLCTGHWGGAACDACDAGYAGEDCNDCADGFVADPAESGVCIADPCQPDPCSGNGACTPLGADAFDCACAARFDGPRCAQCAAGCAGAACDVCAAGFVPDPGAPNGATVCVVDPCQPDPCNGHGACSPLGADTFECACAGRFDGAVCDQCAAGYAGAACDDCAVGFVPDPGVAGVCVADPCQPDPCNGNGACTPLGADAFACACAGRWDGAACDQCVAGHAGVACDECAAGYTPDPAAPGDCIADPCAAEPCSGHGACAVLGAEAFACACVGHWDGATCDQCAAGYAGPACDDCAAGHQAEGADCVPDAGPITWCAVSGPSALWTEPGEATPIEGRVLVEDGTAAPGRLPGVTARLCWAADPLAVDGLDGLTCVPAAFAGDAGDAGDHDAYVAPLAVDAPGAWAYVFAFSGDGGQTWTTCDLAGIAPEPGDPVDPAEPGQASAFNVANGGFERWKADTGLPEGWSADPGVLVEPALDAGHSGAAAVALTRDTTDNGETDFVGPEHPVTSGALHTFGMWYRDTDPSARGTLIYTWYDANHEALGGSAYTYQYTSDGPDWQLVTKDVGAPADATFVRIGTRVYGQSGGTPTGGVVVLDDAFVRPVCDETACPVCDEGFTPDPAAPGTCMADPCQAEPCNGRGECVALDGALFECVCDGPWAGATCDRCADGYAGPECAECAPGFHAEDAACVADVVTFDGCAVVPPGAFWTEPGEATPVVGRVRVDGLTAAPGRLTGVAAQLCWAAAPLAAPLALDALTCVPAVFAGDDGDDDTYVADVAFPAAGRFGVVLALSGDGGATWRTCDKGGLVGDATPDPAEAVCFNVANGGFERWDAAAELPAGWEADPDVGVSPVSLASHSGRSAVALARNTTDNGETDVTSPEHPVEGGAAYTLSLWCLDEDPSARGTLIHTWYDAAHQVVGGTNYSYRYSDDAADWQAITKDVTAPPEAAFVRVGTRVYGQSGGTPTGGVIYLDDVAVIPLAP